MLFNSELFIFYFLPILLILYYIPGNRFRNLLLMVAGLIFYGYGEPKFVFALLFSMLVNYGLGIFLEKATRRKRKILLGVGIGINVVVLFVFKYLNFSLTILSEMLGEGIPVTQILLPLGISFYTFQAISYLIDIYRKDTPAEKNVVNALLFLSFFPQLIAGPILRYKNLASEIKKRQESFALFSEGAKRFIIGLSKKTILANNLAIVAERSFAAAGTQDLTICGAWMGMLCYTLQIYYDFSGYSDMAIGLGKMFGFHFDENFRYPYMAKDVADFWRRWHISLSSWFRDYVYIPLGGSKEGTAKSIRNLFVVWLLTGIWHGANYTFVVWGLGYFVLLFIEKYVLKPRKRSAWIQGMYRIGTLLCVMVLWVVFNSPTLSLAGAYIGRLFACGQSTVVSGADFFFLKEYRVIILWSVLCAAPIIPRLTDFFQKRKLTAVALETIKPTVFFFLLIYSISFIVMGAHNPFIYFNF